MGQGGSSVLNGCTAGTGEGDSEGLSVLLVVSSVISIEMVLEFSFAANINVVDDTDVCGTASLPPAIPGMVVDLLFPKSLPTGIPTKPH